MGQVIGIVFLVAALILGGGVLILLLRSKNGSSLHNLMRASRVGDGATAAETRKKLEEDETGEEYERLKQTQRRSVRSKSAKITKEERYFHAGMFTARERRDFERLRIIVLMVMVPVCALVGTHVAGQQGFLLGLAAGGIGGYIYPTFALDRRIGQRNADILYYLPLVIEQVAIGVSSSLDVGPCLQRVVSMADERDTHNPVTELLKYAQFLIKSGASLEESLKEIGARSGHTELKHAFLALASVAKHGGEISRQLQELADAVASQRESAIDAKIKKLELEATGPVALVFFGFMIVLIIGFGIQILNVFQGV